MSFIDQERRARPASVAAVALVHVAIGYAIISGLAIRVIDHIPGTTKTYEVPVDLPPPPPIKSLPPQHESRVQPVIPPVIVDTGVPKIPNIDVFPPPPSAGGDTVTVEKTTPPPPLPNLARGASVQGNRAAWVTTEDYTSAAIRAEIEGVTAILVTIGTDGRVTDCKVTASSGDAVLDQVACKVYSRRARFAPALDEAGKPMVTTRADRIRWQLPPQ